MTGFNHGLTGAVIAIAIKRPELAIPLAFLSHFVQDAVPHWDYGIKPGSKEFFDRRFNVFLISDFVFSLSIMAFVLGAFPDQFWLVWACMIAAAVPDLTWGYYYLYLEKIKRQKVHLNMFAKLHSAIEWSESLPGAAVEVAWLIAFSFLILVLR